jgi:hypothetical protein
MDPAQGPATPIDILNDRTKLGKFIFFTDDMHVLGDGSSQLQGVSQKTLALQLQESLIPAHSGTLAARQNINRDFIHMLIIVFSLS